MIFNKKLIAIAVAITCVSSTFAMDDEQQSQKKIGYTITIPTYTGLKEAAVKRGVAATQWTVDKAYDLSMKADNFSGNRLSAAGNLALWYAQTADAFIAGKVQGSRLEAWYAWPKETSKAIYIRLHDIVYPHLD